MSVFHLHNLMDSVLFEMWNLQDISGKRQLQNLIHPAGFIFNKELGHIEPKITNMFFSIKPYISDDNNQTKKTEQTAIIQFIPFRTRSGT